MTTLSFSAVDSSKPYLCCSVVKSVYLSPRIHSSSERESLKSVFCGYESMNGLVPEHQFKGLEI